MNFYRKVYLSLGSNQGNRFDNLQSTVNEIAKNIGSIPKVSSIYETTAWGFESHHFLNCCIEVHTHLSPEELLKSIHKIEKDKGRKLVKNKEEYTDRIIDIDILLFDNEVIFEKELRVPHVELLNRKFVLVPLAEITPNEQHPVVNKTIKDCLSETSDTGEVTLIDEKLVRPQSLEEKYNYIVIEGNIGAGKTTLTKKLAESFKGKLLLERVEDNPFLPKFYEQPERFAFPLEMSFLADRYQQLSDTLGAIDLYNNFIISDYYVVKSLLFAQVTLQKEELAVYKKVFDVMYRETHKPDLYVYLHQNTNRLLENISKRGKAYETNISKKYLDKVDKSYHDFIKKEQQLSVLEIDVSNMDFVANQSDYDEIIRQMLAHKTN